MRLQVHSVILKNKEKNLQEVFQIKKNAFLKSNRVKNRDFFSSIFNSEKNKNFTNELNALQNKLQALFDEDETYRKLENELQNKINELKKSIDTQRNAADNENTQYEAWKQNLNNRKEKYSQITDSFDADKANISRGLDLSKEYEKASTFKSVV